MKFRIYALAPLYLPRKREREPALRLAGSASHHHHENP
jgi:hypothetical protein